MSALYPPEALDSHIGILGKTGSGKSNGAKVIAERLMKAGERVCMIDPTGTYWGLRLMPNGKPSPFHPVIFGGEHADIEITEAHGAVIAEAIGTSSDSAIIDTRLMGSNARTRFFAAFAEALLRTNRGPLHLIIDEAHLFAPQGKVNSPDAGRMLAEANELVSRGRSAGLRVILISQRPAKLHKDSLTQVETLIAMRLIAPQDRAAVQDWVGEWADPVKGKEVVGSLPSMAVGDAWVWSPTHGFLERVHFPLAVTFDSGKPLSRDEAAPQLTALDATVLGERMDTIRQEAMANDPKRLKARIAELEREIAKAPLPGATKAELDAAYELGKIEGHADGWYAGFGDATKQVLDLAANLARDLGAEPLPSTLASKLHKAGNGAENVADRISLVVPKTEGKPYHPDPQVMARQTDANGDRMSPSSVKLVDAIVAAYPAGMSLATAAKRAGLSKRSSAFGRYLKEAAASPRITLRDDGKYVAVAAEAGLAAPAGLDDFKRSLPPSYARMLEAVERFGDGLALSEIADRAGVSRTSSGLSAGIKELLALGLVEQQGSIYVLHPDFN
jgi:hypothetical protein